MEQKRNADALVVWILSVLLAAAFATTGIAKLTGTEPIGLQAAAMNGFPSWIRTVVGTVEVAGAAAILVPPVAAFAASLLALLMIPATITQWISGEPGIFVPILMFALLLIVAWRRNPAAVRAGYNAAVHTPRPLLREGAIVGAIGATVIAVWFFFVDIVAADAFFTPRTLGSALAAVFQFRGVSPLEAVATYTVFHYSAFVVLGLTASLIVNYARREPSILLGFVVLFAATEVGFYALVSLLQQITALGSLAWYNVMGGNLIAAVAMGAYLWRLHPELRGEFKSALTRTA
jgi:putative oxidoreductase